MSPCTASRSRMLLAGFAVAFLLVLTTVASETLFGVMVPDEEWLNIQLISVHLKPASHGNDSFVLNGSFNVSPAKFDPACDFTLTFDTLSINIPSGAWEQKKGKGTVLKAKVGGVNVQVDWWVGGSSRCNFKVVASKQDLLDHSPSFPDMPVTLSIPGGFNESATAFMEETSKVAAKLFELGDEIGESLFVIDKLDVKRNLRQSGRDSATLTGRMFVNGDVEPSDVGIYGSIGDVSFFAPVGSLVVKGARITYSGDLAGGGKVTFSADGNKGKITAKFTKVDLSGLANPVTVRLGVTGAAEVQWPYRLIMQESKNGAAFKY